MIKCALARLWPAILLASLAVIFGPSAAGSSAAEPCQVFLHLAPTPDSTTYDATLIATQRGEFTVKLTLYSETAAYSVVIPALAFDVSIGLPADHTGPRPYGAAPLLIVLPKPDALRNTRTESSFNGDGASLRCLPTVAISRPGSQRDAELFARLSPRVVTARIADSQDRPTCATPHSDAKTLDQASIVYPAGAQGATGRVTVKVSLAPTGVPRAISLYKSSGNDFLDQAALTAAASSTYSAEVEDCVPVGGIYLFVVDFARR